MGTGQPLRARICTTLASVHVSHVWDGWGLDPTYLKDSKVGSVPGSKKNVGVRAETGLVYERGGKVVPCPVGATVNSRDLVVGQGVVLVHGLEPLHAKDVQVPLIGVLVQLTDLKPWVGCPARAACTVGAAWARDGDGAGRLTLLEFVGDVVDASLEGSIGRASGMLLAGAVLQGDGDVEEREEGDEHGHHALRLAEIDHGEENWLHAERRDEGGQGLGRLDRTTWQGGEETKAMRNTNERNDPGVDPEV